MSHSSAPREAFSRVASWENLLEAYRKASRGKRGGAAAATFEHRLADHLIELREELLSFRYRPGDYVHFRIHEPKARKISAAPFRDRVVHHALCNVIEPRFERRFVFDSYANRRGKGTHAALDRLQAFARRQSYVLRLDLVQHFASLDHAVLLETLRRVIPEDDVMGLVETILASGEGVLDDEYRMVWFPGDDLLAACRPRGLPIGNLTSQFWSNCYLDPFDHFVKRELRCRSYLRYVDDFALFSDSRSELWAWKRAIVERLASLRLTIHERSAGRRRNATRRRIVLPAVPDERAGRLSRLPDEKRVELQPFHTPSVVFRWDPKKAAANVRKHEVGFHAAGTVLDDPLSTTFPEPRSPASWKANTVARGSRLMRRDPRSMARPTSPLASRLP